MTTPLKEPLTDFDKKVLAAIGKAGQFLPPDFLSYMGERATISQPPVALSQITGLGCLAYTPTWTSTGTQPALVNGTLSGRYCKIGFMVHCWGSLIMGSSTTFGTGGYRWALPVPPHAALASAQLHPLGTILLRDSSTSNFALANAVVSSTANAMRGIYLSAYPTGTVAEVAQTTPWTWATTDEIYWNIVYEAA